MDVDNTKIQRCEADLCCVLLSLAVPACDHQLWTRLMIGFYSVAYAILAFMKGLFCFQMNITTPMGGHLSRHEDKPACTVP